MSDVEPTFAVPTEPFATSESAPETRFPSRQARKMSAGMVLPLVALLLATVWLVVSVVVGMGVMKGADPTAVSFTVSSTQVDTSSRRMSYGGDAYTGIQNAASDTAHAVVDSANALSAVIVDAEKASALLTSKVIDNGLAPMYQGLGFLIIGLGVVPFVLTLSRVSVSMRAKK